ncbi:MAG: TonB-dependent receptor [Williamsia sp.]|nr:TonB-dependent receptor [Williamsia sp.]
MQGPRTGQAAPPSIGHIYGKIVDSLDKPVAAASVVLLQTKFDTAAKKRKEVLLKAITAASNGDFSFEDLPIMGALRLKVSAVGYKNYEQAVQFQLKMPAAPAAGPKNSNPMAAMSSMVGAFDKDLGNIRLTTDLTQLQSVTVTASAPGLKMDIDKKTFNVDKNIVTAGGTAVDVMRNVPSLQVDIDGNVKLRNASPQIYIDGRPTTLTLDQIPADAIQSVEVITNPSAKFDASGGNAGILNIVLKKNKKTGYNGTVMAGVDRRGGYNGGGNFSVRQGKINLTASAMTNGMRNRATGYTDRQTFGTKQTHVYQDNIDKTKGAFTFGRVGLDYYITNRTTISAAGVRVHGAFKPNSLITSDSLNTSNQLMNFNTRNTNGSRSFDASGLQLGMVHNFKKEGMQLTADANYFSATNDGNSMYTTKYYNSTGNYLNTALQQQLSNGTNQFLTVQTDYVNPITAKTKLEAGLRAQARKTTSNTDNYNQGPNGNLAKNLNATNNYKNNDNVYAAYATVTSSIKTFGYQLGLRAESSNYKGDVTNKGQQFKNNYPISLFPSVFLSQKLQKNQELQLNYSRRINRPNFFQLIPYTDSADLTNITRGNPGLVPEFTNSLEFSYSKTLKGNNSILFSVYYKHTNHLITRYLDSSYNPEGRLYLINTFVNANSSYNYGAELTSVNNIKKWWDVTTNLNLYRSKINTSNLQKVSQDALLSWFGKLNNNFKLPKSFTVQLSADYQSKTSLPVTSGQQQMGPPGMQAQSSSQGYIKPFWGIDLAVKKSFLKDNAASLTLSVNDIFRTRYNEQVSLSSFFYQDYYRLNNPQMVRLNFVYRFGKLDVSLFKRQNTKSTATQDAMQMGQ